MNMNANMNTENSLRCGLAMEKACEKTQKQLAERMRSVGLPDGKTVKVTLPLLPEGQEQTVFCGINGARFYFRRGVPVTMPEAAAEILRNCGELK